MEATGVFSLFHLFTFLSEKIEDQILLAQWGGLGILTGGILLYFLRERRRRLYATLEIAFGVVGGGAAIGRVKEQGNFAVWLAVAGSAYLVVRGIDNMQKSGLTQGQWSDLMERPRSITRKAHKQPEQHTTVTQFC